MAKHLDLTPEEKARLGSRIVELWRDDNADRASWLANLPQWLDAYMGRPRAKKEPWEGASAFHVPLTRTHIEAIHPRIIAALHQPEPIASFKAQEPSDADRARKTETFMDWAVREDVPLFPTEDRAVLGTLINGIQIVKVTWELKTRHLRSTHDFPPDILPDEAVAAVVKGEQKLVEALMRVEGEAAQEALKKLQKDREIVLEVSVTPTSIRVVTERAEVVRDAPRYDLINPEDFVVNSDASYDIQDADHAIHRYWMTLPEVKAAARRGTFKLTEEEIEQLGALQTTDLASGSDDNTVTIKQVREGVTGADVTSRTADPSRLEVLAAYLGDDLNEDGDEEQLVVITFKAHPKIIARAVRLEDEFRHGMRPFVAFPGYPVAGSFWSTGVPQMLEGIQIELNTIHNQRVDAGTIGNTPFGWYVPAAGFNPEPMKLQPGYLIPVDDVSRVKMHQPGNYTAWSMQEEAGLLAMAEKLTKVNDLTLGRIGESQGAARTASGVQALASQQASGFDIVIRRFQEGHKRLLQMTLACYAQYMPPDREIRILGKYANDPETLISRDDLTGQYDLRFTGNSLNTDREIVRQALTYLAQGPMNPQVLGGLTQMGITSPPGIAEWYRHLLRSFDVPGLDRIIQMPEQPAMATPETIINRTISGESVPIQPGEDHQAVIGALTSILNGPAVMGLAPESIVAMQTQIQKRQQQAQMDQMVQMMQQQMAMQQMAVGGPPGGAPTAPGPPGMPPPGAGGPPPPGAPPQPAAPPRPAVFGA